MICPTCQREIAENSNFCYLCGARQAAQPVTPPSVAPRYKEKRLMRSSRDVKIAGVCAGFGEYFDVDPTVVRFVWVLLFLLPVPVFPAFLGYIAAWLIMPRAPLPIAENAPAREPATHTA
jgi:phage shock protein C